LFVKILGKICKPEAFCLFCQDRKEYPLTRLYRESLERKGEQFNSEKNVDDRRDIRIAEAALFTPPAPDAKKLRLVMRPGLAR